MNPFSQEYSSKKAVIVFLPWFLLLVAGLWLRVGSLETRTVHADEGVQGMITCDLLETGDYAYNPEKFHGPSLYYLSLPVAWLRGQHTRAELDILSLRLVPFIFSLVMCLAPILFYPELGRIGSLVASGFLLFSPGLVYYGSFYIQESLLVAGFAAFAGCYWRYRKRPHTGWAFGMGLAAGLMATSKESFPLYLAVVLVAGWLVRPQSRSGKQEPVPSWRALVIALGAASILIIPLFSSFGSHWTGLVDAVTGLYRYQPETGHDKPWYYYLSLLSGHQRGLIGVRGEGLLLVWALVAGGLLVFRGKHQAVARFLVLMSAFLLICFSLFSYKTPWLLMGALFPMALLAGLVTRIFPLEKLRTVPVAALGLLVLASWALSIREALWTTRDFPVEKRNPYAYVHTSWDLPELADQVLELYADLDQPVVKVIADEYWPLPWYLREVNRVGYWSTVPDDPYAPVMVVSAELAGSLDPDRLKAYQYAFRGLRPGKILLLYYKSD